MLTISEIVDLAARHGLALDQSSVSINSSGLDFLAVFAADEKGESWVLRIPRRPDAAHRAQKERRILDLVAPCLTVQVPRWEIVSERIIAYRRLEGHPAATIDMEAKAYVWRMDEKNVAPAFERSLAHTLAELHRVEAGKAVDAGLRVLLPGQLRKDMHERMLRTRMEFGTGDDVWQRWRAWLANDSIWPDYSVLVHGDLHAGHILIDRTASVTGIIDWTEAMVGDPAIDFAGYLTTFGDEATGRFIAAYQEAGGRVWPGMFEHIVEMNAASGVFLAEFAMTSGLEEYRQMARQALGVAKQGPG
ncbi:MAG: macrolide 2'-phosphotransferase [Phycisphaeraceae bacterium]|nr:macrolide 2'-phosphotransferase [Phycisphaeraceae bacterium]